MMIAQDLEQSIEQTKDITPDVIFPPSDLYSDEPPVETELHLRQIILLLQCLEWLWKDRTDFYTAGNLTIYYSPHQKKNEKSRGPDFFVVLGTERKTRKSWVVWDEDGKYPNVIIEILSPSTANSDKVTKKELYQNTFRTPDYFWFDPYTLEFVGFYLTNGQYQPLEPNEKGYLWSEQLGLYLGVHEGLLRYFTPEGDLVPTPEETAEEETKKAVQADARAKQESKRAAQADARAERLAAKLRELNIDPETI
ncbi:Uma2 family endonuclease [Sphaerospermopsis sp. FACHB-1094]|jgi:Uma2 family endonuclease|uniref:Uma2 family endonuclease n=1 Tax=Sphaerospermopsis aphanizomenoides LEGE 00250 TaxID=2777972 RepID=A0ABR9V8J3_9CYAN|nr:MULTISPECIES: Uma2 family endonuclease [Sphaerospermopsis]MBD2134233.1 Uma2 family endonuclease [Sphaerospermopsis sp. FACHB-1094]MBE9234814.1 Uma2 family endonuclease [Sphaerospermopsis aphanizomenoides LEGE 00250]